MSNKRRKVQEPAEPESDEHDNQPDESDEEGNDSEGSDAGDLREGDEDPFEDMEFEEDEMQPKSAYRWHFDMLHDTERNEKFSRSIKKALQNLPKKSRKDAAVLDIGTGSGLLAVMAHLHGAKHVTAIEVDPVLASMAEAMAEQNEIKDIAFHAAHSSAVTLAELAGETKADILVTEVLDSGLIGEDFLPTLRDAHARLLKPDAVVIPASAEIWAQLIDWSGFRDWQFLDEKRLGVAVPEDIKADSGAANPHDAHLANLLSKGYAKFLSAPFKALSFDFKHPPSQGGRSVNLKVPVTAAGNVHAVAFWWRCTLDAEGKEVLDTSVEHNLSRDHWYLTGLYSLSWTFQ
jgi:hypothetical protein